MVAVKVDSAQNHFRHFEAGQAQHTVGNFVAKDLWTSAIDGSLKDLFQQFQMKQDLDAVSEDEKNEVKHEAEEDKEDGRGAGSGSKKRTSVFDDSDDEFDDTVIQTKSEIEKFVELASTVPSKYEGFDILLWWKTNQAQFPLLAKVARSILCIPASSAESERVFSAASNIVTEKRTRILPKNLDGLITIKSNIRFIQ